MADERPNNLGKMFLSNPLQCSLISLVLGVHLIYAGPVRDGTSGHIRDIGGGGFEIVRFEKSLHVALPDGHVGGELPIGQLPEGPPPRSPTGSPPVLTEYIKQENTGDTAVLKLYPMVEILSTSAQTKEGERSLVRRPARSYTDTSGSCALASCSNGATCSEAEDPWGWGYYCICAWADGSFGGRRCQIKNPCQKAPCPGETPRCFTAFEDVTGRHCYKALPLPEPRTGPCASSPCENGGRCSEAEDPWGWGYYCLCDWESRMFGGRRCQILNPCVNNRCPHVTDRCYVGYDDWSGRTCYDNKGRLVSDL